MRVVDLGRQPYRQTWELQKQVLAERIQGAGEDTLLLVEHEPVFTLGRARSSLQHVLDPGDAEVIQIERGGDVTWHGPGQLVVYPIVALPPGRQDLHRHLSDLEQAVIDTCADFGLETGRNERNTGVWVGDRKLASIGIHCRRWVTWHGLALNVAPDMSWFDRIVACGLEGVSMTSLAEQLSSGCPDMHQVKGCIVTHLQRLLPSP